MRKYAIFLISALLGIRVTAQPIMGYEFDAKASRYEEISGGTVIGAGITGADFNGVAFNGSDTPSADPITAEGFPIGFNFVFNNQEMNRFAIGTNGYLVLGKEEVYVAAPGKGFHAVGTSDLTNVIAAVTNGEVRGLDETELSYKLMGEAPARVLVVQYKNWGLTDRWGDGVIATAQLQFRLYESSNKIEIIYKDWKISLNSILAIRAGIKGNSDDRLIIRSKNDSWAGVLDTTIDADKTIEWNEKSYPADGLICSFTAPENCVAPDTQPTGLNLTGGSISVSGNFIKSPAADHYLVLMNNSASLTALPEDGISYEAGASLGDAVVISCDTINTFATTELLRGATSYYFHIFGVNTFCMFGPKYNREQPLTGHVITNPDKPDGLTIEETGLNKMALSAVSNSAKDNILIGMTLEPSLSEYGDIQIDGLFGQPSGDMNVGDKIPGGGSVVYKGAASKAIEIKNLLENTVYHFKVWSVNSDNIYSTVGETANDITWGRVPYVPDYSKMPVYESPVGWIREGNMFRLANDNSTAVLECNIQRPNPSSGVENALTTPWIVFEEGINRIVFKYNMSEWSRMGTTAYNNWEEGDVLEIQASDNGTDFETVYRVTKANAPKFASATSYVNAYATFDKFAGKKVKIRIYWKCYKGIKLLVKDLKIEEKPACDYPVDLSVDKQSLIGDQAKISWKSQGEENLWEIRYKIAGAEEWGTPVEVNQNPYTLTKLPAQTDIELQVRAKCSLSSQSDWSETLSFRTGYGVPFTENFKVTELPAGWSFETGALAEPTEFCVGGGCTKQWTWYASRGLYAVMLSPNSGAMSADEWVLSPIIDLGDGSVNYVFNFELNMQSALPDNDESYSVVISPDGGQTFSSEHVLKKIEKSELPGNRETKMFSASLKGYKGRVRIGIYVKSTTGKASTTQLTSVSVTPSCVSDVVATVKELTATDVKITWEGTADDWLVFSRMTGETMKEYKRQTTKELILENLQPRTGYEVGITRMCEVGDTAQVTIVAFTTLALEPCAQPANVTAIPSQHEAIIAWEGEAMAYNVRCREKGAEDWIIKQTIGNTLTLTGLETETEYEYGVQAVCSTVKGDVSDWTDTAVFTTLAVTCFPPINVVAVPTHKSVTVSWEGEAEKYEVEYCKEGEEWLQLEVTGYTVTVEGLQPETNYKVHVRSLCSATDISLWSATVNFKTHPIPECTPPTNLTASDIGIHSVKLSWDADDINLSWDVRYRAGNVTSWTTIAELSEKECTLDDLQAGTYYLWSVKAACDEGRTSAWAAQGNFTMQATGINTVGYGSLKVFASGKIVNIANPEHLLISRVQIFTPSGQIVSDYALTTDENILIPVSREYSQLIVRVSGEQWHRSFRVLVTK